VVDDRHDARVKNALRDLDLAAPGAVAGRVVANRGLAGIDGLLSTAVGVALVSRAPAYALVGDLTFLHDSGGLLIGRDEPHPDLTVVVVNDESGITSLDDLSSGDVTITALVGSTAANLVTTTFPDAELVELEQQPAFLEVASGRADAIVVEEYLALPFVEENDGVSVLNPDQPFSQEYGRLAVPRGDVLWLEYVDNWLDYYTANGTLDGLYEDIIGPTDGLPQ